MTTPKEYQDKLTKYISKLSSRSDIDEIIRKLQIAVTIADVINLVPPKYFPNPEAAADRKNSIAVYYNSLLTGVYVPNTYTHQFLETDEFDKGFLNADTNSLSWLIDLCTLYSYLVGLSKGDAVELYIRSTQMKYVDYLNMMTWIAWKI